MQSGWSAISGASRVVDKRMIREALAGDHVALWGRYPRFHADERTEPVMTDLPKIPKSAVKVLNIAGVFTLEDCATWSSEELAALRGFGPKAFRTVEASMRDAGLGFDPDSEKRAEPINRAMAEERMRDVIEPSGPSNLPKIGAPATRALAQIGVRNVEQLADYTEAEILALHGIGPSAIPILQPVMEEMGVRFRDE
jgi:predicted flap endonuclease-1-like 5' DNA nuclease